MVLCNGTPKIQTITEYKKKINKHTRKEHKNLCRSGNCLHPDSVKEKVSLNNMELQRLSQETQTPNTAISHKD